MYEQRPATRPDTPDDDGPEPHERTEDSAPGARPDDRLRRAWPLNPPVPITFYERP
ncbi:hypothetical protein [Streptomyces eurocidicus]|uniref:Uncharacterized protein n=1 Tax=Streptomyces eurocidicus TaxID=66423 RepID=A0A7W8B5A6_STREU|nr:hypothetical protein [Streptomyces eurocidicus]MBB5117075.1 hypothetical protein [Streptomyces eurocidicus]MBF6052628.1 hypothetical protein [Streptomyces eurocidicus]